ncbi:hypothetical protein GGI20_004342 [Coemansia sp. BCRC 34301]|nr:hypothetical protein GGI20_004342 [Coemansia sp. BCRC 34301]
MTRFDDILGLYESQDMFTKEPSVEHFSYYASLLDDVRTAARSFNKRYQRDLRAEIERLYKRYAHLFNENWGRNCALHRDKLEFLANRALDLTEKAAVNTQRLTCAKWIHCGAEETVAHLTGECRDFESFRDQFFLNWIALANTVAPALHKELTEAAKKAAAEEQAEANALAAEVGAPPPELSALPCVAAIVFPALPVAAPELDN